MITALLTSLLAISQQQTPAHTPDQIDVLGADGSWRSGILEPTGAVQGEDGSDLLQRAIGWIPKRNRVLQQRRPFALAQLADGQMLVGSFGGFVTTESGSVSRWKHHGLGMVSVPIDQTVLIQFEPLAGSLTAADADVMLLRNGDRLGGFVKSVSAEVEMEVQGVVQPVPVERIAGIALVHAVQKGGPVRVWIDDGSVLDATRIDGGFAGGFVLRGLTLVAGKSTLPLMPDDIEGVALQPHRIRSLALQSPRVEASTAAALPRVHRDPPQAGDVRTAPLSAASISIRGPIRLIYEVPEGFTTLSATAEIPAAFRQWGDVVLVVRQGEKELLRQPMSGTNPSCSITLPIVAGPLEVEVEEAANGPVGDTVVLTRPLLITPG
jgi:hypothetical protein